MRVVGVIQARTRSFRLPGKMLRPLAGKIMIEWMVERLLTCRELDELTIATTTESCDMVLVKFAERNGLRCYRGSELDVLDRYYQAAREFQADAVLRVTSDCPLIDPVVVDEVVARYCALAPDVDYVTNNFPPTFPHGLDCEVYSLSCLARLWEEVEDPYYRDVIPYYVKEHRDKYRIENVSHVPDLSFHRWTVDYPEDCALVSRILDAAKDQAGVLLMDDVLRLLEAHPDWSEINARWVDGNRGRIGFGVTLDPVGESLPRSRERRA